MPLEHHDGLLSVAKVIVVNTVIWRQGRKGAKFNQLGRRHGVTITAKILPAAPTSHF